MFSNDPNHTLQLPTGVSFYLRYWETNPFTDEPYQVIIYERYAGYQYYAAVLPATATPDIRNAPDVFEKALVWGCEERLDTLIYDLVGWFGSGL